MSEFVWKCICGSEDYTIRYEPWNGVIGPRGERGIEGLNCAQCGLMYAVVPPNPREEKKKEKLNKIKDAAKGISQSLARNQPKTK